MAISCPRLVEPKMLRKPPRVWMSVTFPVHLLALHVPPLRQRGQSSPASACSAAWREGNAVWGRKFREKIEQMWALQHSGAAATSTGRRCGGGGG